MHINRQTYEEFFLLYTDGELSADEKKAVEEFVKENPDLEQELILLQGSVFEPDAGIVFENKEVLYRHDARVAVLPWFRIAAAAIVVLALTTVGWVYLSQNNETTPPVVASKELVREEKTDKPGTLAQVEPSVTTVSQPIQTPAEKIKTSPSRSSIVITVSQPSRYNVEAQPKSVSNENAGVIQSERVSPEASNPDHDVVMSTENNNEVTDMAVTPRDIEQQTALAPVETNSTVQYVEAEEDNIIYFANTSLPKKSKLRGVFRKATRFLDKVTSIQ